MRISPTGMHPYILRDLDGHSPLIFVPPCSFSLLQPVSFSPPHLHVPSPSLAPYSMICVQVRCQGCDKAFTPRGLSQHASKTQDLRCRPDNNIPPLDHFRTPFIPRTASCSSPSLIRMPDAPSDAQPGDQYHGTPNEGLDDVPELGDISSNGASFMTHDPAQDGDTFPPRIEI